MFGTRQIFPAQLVHGLAQRLHLPAEVGAGIADAQVHAQAGAFKPAQIPVQAFGNHAVGFLAAQSYQHLYSGNLLVVKWLK
jgi:hypothetical protein